MAAPALATVNATLNAAATVLLLRGYSLIRQKRRERHRATMLAAFGVSIAFLICYVIYHLRAGTVYYHGAFPALYFPILITHVVLAAAVPVLAVITIRRAWLGRYDKHRAIARWTFPIWLYVSVTGVLVYLMLYIL
jgi:uncharacterized membrane protein YozB (DUF420 family)